MQKSFTVAEPFNGHADRLADCRSICQAGQYRGAQARRQADAEVSEMCKQAQNLSPGGGTRRGACLPAKQSTVHRPFPPKWRLMLFRQQLLLGLLRPLSKFASSAARSAGAFAADTLDCWPRCPMLSGRGFPRCLLALWLA